MSEPLGTEIRAGRLRYYWLDECERYVRIETFDDGLHALDICSPDGLPRRPGGDTFVLWHLDGKLREMLVPIVQKLKRRGDGRYFVDDNGSPVGVRTP